MSLHWEDPLMGNLNSGVCIICRASRREKLHHYPSRDVTFGAICAATCRACSVSSVARPGPHCSRRTELTAAARFDRRPGAGPTAVPYPEPPDPYNNGCLTCFILPGRPVQHRLSLTITGPSQPLREYAFNTALQADGQARHVIAMQIAPHANAEA